jgi:hypothetical protein
LENVGNILENSWIFPANSVNGGLVRWENHGTTAGSKKNHGHDSGPISKMLFQKFRVKSYHIFTQPKKQKRQDTGSNKTTFQTKQ